VVQSKRGFAAGTGVLAAVVSLAVVGALTSSGTSSDGAPTAAGPATSTSASQPANPTAPSSASSASSVASPAGAGIRGLKGEVAPGAVLPGPAPQVLPPLGDSAPAPDPTVLQARLLPLIGSPALGGSVSVDVVDPASGRHLAGAAANVGRTPASTAKILTAAAALALIGPDTPLRTRVVEGPTPDEIFLVGAGDVLLSTGRGDPLSVDGRAGLADLAARTATALKAAGRTRVAVRLDDQLFQGPAISRDWPPGDITSGFVAPIMSLEVHAGRLSTDRFAKRSPDPAMAAAKAFTVALGKQGIAVTGAVARAASDSTAKELAAVESAPLGDIVEFALTESDNTVAEALARLVAWRAGRPATFDDAGVAILDQVSLLGVPTVGARLVGGSGLGADSRIPAGTLTGVLAVAANDQHPQLRRMLTGLPVAGASGTLADRFSTGGLRAAAGVVRAKTGTLNGVHSLAGTVVDADGRLLVFAVLADAAPKSDPALKAIDSMAATLAGCGCR
jgi:serine-type D-Ala-D-Ala carboxypeptidase/endopeptidase (penicillin-binding protein 4)